MKGLAITLSLLSATALANIRAPQNVAASPSTALYAPATDGGLTITAETLSFDCDERCTVTAVYDVTADVEQQLSFEFILPVKEQLSVKVGKADAGVQVADAEPLEARDSKSDLSVRKPRGVGSENPPTPLFRAKFDGKLTKGQNRITASYQQQLMATESDYGYTGTGRFLKEIQYELWPIKEWKLAQGFALTTTVSMKRKAPGFFKSVFGEVPTVSCEGRSGTGADDSPLKRTKIPIDPVQSGGKLELRFALRDGIPDRLHCFFGDTDLHPGK